MVPTTESAFSPSTERTPYLRICQLASGGIGTVEVALRIEGRFRRLYAIKRLQGQFRDDEDFRAMFLDEARLAGLIRHPNVVSVLDVGEDAQGPFLVMDYVEGLPTGALIARAFDTGRDLPLQVSLRVIMDAAQGLHAAHELNDDAGQPLHLVHRDVSPQNLLVGFDGVTRVTDFGVAKAYGRATRTATGVLKGKFGYMSPEQLQFEEPDRRSDLFSLGVVLFELLAGRRLYRNTSGMDGVRRILHEPPPDIGEFRDDVPPELVALLFALLAKDPGHRPADARSVALTLETVLNGVVMGEGRLEMDAYMADAFVEERREQAKRIREGTEAAEASAGHRIECVDGSESFPPIRTTPAQSRRRALAVLTLGITSALAILGLVASLWWSRERTTDPVGRTVTTSSIGSSASTTAGPLGPAPAEARTDGAVDGSPGTVSPAPARRSDPRSPHRRRRGHLRTRKKAKTKTSSGVPQWSWQ